MVTDTPTKKVQHPPFPKNKQKKVTKTYKVEQNNKSIKTNNNIKHKPLQLLKGE
jgi:hypothetical protein